MFDPWLLKLVKISQKLWRIKDYTSDAIVLKLASYDTVQKLITLEESESETIAVDTGNLAVTVVSLIFMRLCSYAVNARNINWKDREMYCWDNFLWLNYFHTSGSTMMTNERKMLL